LYAAFCALYRERRKDPQSPVPAILKKNKNKINSMKMVYRVFGDPHLETLNGRPYHFDVWYEGQKELLEKLNLKKQSADVQDFLEGLPAKIEQCLGQSGEDTLSGGLAGPLVKQLQSSLPPKLYLEIDLASDDTGPLLKAINDLINQAKNTPKMRWWNMMTDRATWPRTRKDLAILKRYLAIYDLSRQGVKMPTIVRKVGTKEQKDNYNDENVIAFFREELAKARRIVKNTEEGVFPGYYGKYSI
jgi:hypothetical protein